MKEVAFFLDKPVMGSSTWKAILNAMNFIHDNFTLNIGDGDDNVWFNHGLLRNLCVIWFMI